MLPSKDEMLADIHKKEEAMAQKFVSSQRHTIQVDFIPFMVELAKMAGCNPNFGNKIKLFSFFRRVD